MKCSKLLFKKDFFKKNYGNYIVLTLFFTQIINLIIFFINGFNNINLSLIKMRIKKVNNNQINYDIPNYSNKHLSNINLNINNHGNPPRKFNYRKNFNLESSNSTNKSIKNYNQNDILSSSREISSLSKESNKNDNESKNTHYIYKIGKYINKYFNKLKGKSNSINNTNEEKKEYQKRKYFENKKDDFIIPELEITNIKCSILFCKNIKKKHKLISLFNTNKYDISVYKFSIFILTLTLDLLFCCLFNSSSNIRKLYQKQKKFTGKEVLIGFYSLLPSYFITKLIDCCMEYKNDLKYYISNSNKMNSQFLKKYKSKTICKFIFYFILNFIFTAFTWYVIVLFCSTYPNSIINLLLCFLFNFIFSFFIPFFIRDLLFYLNI